MAVYGKILLGLLRLSEVVFMKVRQIVFLLLFAVIYLTGCLEQPSIVTVVNKNQIVEEPEPIVEPEPEPEPEPEIIKQLTLMVYMAADNDLESYALQNLNQMELADCENLNVLVLMDRSEGYDETDGDWKDTRLFEVCKDISGTAHIVSRRIDCPDLGLSNHEKTELDMANPYVLSNFIEFVKRQYLTEKYALIIWGHGTGWRYKIEENRLNCDGRAVAIDDKTGSYMQVTDLGNALRGQGLNVIGFDTCFGGVFENVYELKNCAEFTVGSPGITPGAGWDYKSLLENLSAGVFSSRTIAEQMCNSSSAKTTVFCNEKLETLMNSFESFSKNLANQIISENKRRSVFNTLFNAKSYKYTQYPCDMYLDIYSMAELYANDSNKVLAASAEQLKRDVCAVTLSDTGYGIGVHFIPLVSSQITAVTHSFDYIKNPENSHQCLFIKESLWWVPTYDGKTGSLLNKLFYTDY